jgi:subtilisin family serine protease
MKKTGLLLIWTLLGLFIANTIQAQLPASFDKIEGELIVQLRPDRPAERLVDSWNQAHKASESLRLKKLLSTTRNIALLSFNADQINDSWLMESLQEDPSVESVEWNLRLQERRTEPNDPFFEAQWGLELIEAPRVWDYTTGGVNGLGHEVVVAILDSGFDISHEDFQGNIWVNEEEQNGLPNVDDDQNGYIDDVNGWNFANTSPTHPISSHGTSVAGIVGANGDNGIGVSGVNWGTKLMLCSVSTTGNIIEAYEYILNHRKRFNNTLGTQGTFVVATNASLGIPNVLCEDFPSWGEAYDPLGEAGVLNAGATANENVDVDVTGDLPTSCSSDYLISVTNTDQLDTKVFNSGFGKISIDLSAPGGQADAGAYSTAPFNTYNESFGGTSASSPHLAGAIGLLYSLPDETLATSAIEDPSGTALLIRDAILEGVDPITELESITVTGGRLNVFKSLLYLHGVLQEYEVDNPINDFSSEKAILNLFPNPVERGELVQVILGTTELESVNIYVCNTLGQIVIRQTVDFDLFEKQFTTVDTWNLAKGMYYLVIENGKTPVSRKFLVY